MHKENQSRREGTYSLQCKNSCDTISKRNFLTETPGKDLIIEGLESLVTDVAIAPLLPSRFRERSLDMIHLLMAQTIEPTVEAHRVRPGEEMETEEAAAETEQDATVENAENTEETV